MAQKKNEFDLYTFVAGETALLALHGCKLAKFRIGTRTLADENAEQPSQTTAADPDQKGLHRIA